MSDKITNGLVRRVKRLTDRGVARQAQRRLRLALPANRATADALDLPEKYRWLRIGTIGPVPEADGLAVRDLLAGADRATGLDLVLISGPSAGGPADLTEDVVRALIACEQARVRTIMLAGAAQDLATPVVTACRDIAGEDDVVVAAARAQVGVARAHLLPQPSGNRSEWLAALTAI